MWLPGTWLTEKLREITASKTVLLHTALFPNHKMFVFGYVVFDFICGSHWYRPVHFRPEMDFTLVVNEELSISFLMFLLSLEFFNRLQRAESLKS
jgi:hypothetical protein